MCSHWRIKSIHKKGRASTRERILMRSTLCQGAAMDKVLFAEVFKIKLGSIPNSADPVVE